jgi:hypothetical protein
MSRISDWVLDMEDKGEVELVETTHNHHLGWVYDETGNSVSITGHEYVAVEQQEHDPSEFEHPFVDEEKERRAGFFEEDTCPK